MSIIQPAAVLLLASTAFAASSDEWRSRTIYQVITDRFSKSNDDTSQCSDWSTYCGGTFEGITNHLDYIQGMGFDAIWISPVVTQIDNGFHGYWAKDFTTINSHFGSDDDLKALVDAAHSRNMFVMVDIVCNHVGPTDDFSIINPFNQTYHYHPSCQIQDWNNQQEVENCRLANLPDLDQSNPDVDQGLKSYVQNLIDNFGFDGLRIDTVPEVPAAWWASFQSTVGVYAVGEVLNGNVGYVSKYQNSLDALLSYPMYFTLMDVFQRHASMNEIEGQLQNYKAFKDVSLLGNFVDNHDNPRFLSQQQDMQLYKSALTYSLLAEGIPIVYYGTEQSFNGGGDPNNREPLWTSGFNQQTDMYSFLKTVIGIRQHQQVWESSQVQRYSDDSFYAFTRGPAFVALTNSGSGGNPETRTISYHPYKDGDVLCNSFNSDDCVTVNGGTFEVSLQNGEYKVYVPKPARTPSFADVTSISIQ